MQPLKKCQATKVSEFNPSRADAMCSQATEHIAAPRKQKRTHSCRATLYLCTILAAFWLGPVRAAPEEIVVFTDEFEKPGETGYEMHFNFAAKARRTPEYPGEQPPHRIFRFMPEVVWGLSDKWNAALHLPMSRSTDTGTMSVDGLKARLQYLNTQKTDTGSVFYGANYELSYFRPRLSESSLVAEVRGILGMRHGDWLFAVNPILNRPLNNVPGVDNRVNLDVFSKVMRNIGSDLAVGFEHYSELGKLRDLTFGPESGQTTYAILEFVTKSHFDIQIGIGHGWTDPVDKRVVKVMVGLPF